jgi:MFS family permease
VLANREFAALLISQTLSVAGNQLARIAVAILVYQRTGSAFAASATYALSYLTYLLGGPVLSAISDRSPRVEVMVVCDLLRAPLILALCISGLPLWTLFLSLAAVGLLSPPFDSACSALQPEILAGDAYVVGNGLIHVVLEFAQVLGFVAGGALVALTSTRGALAVDAATFMISAGVVLALIASRAPAQEAGQRGTLLSDTRQGFTYVRGDAELRKYLMFAVLTSIAIVVPEGMAVPAARTLGGGDIAAGFLTAAIPAGTVLGGFAVLRLPTARRLELLPVLSLFSGLVLLVSPLVQNVSGLVALWVVAGLGNCVSLVSAAAYVQASPAQLRARTYGVAVTALQAGQGLSLLLAGGLAGPLGPRQSVSAMAALVLCGLLALPSLRPSSPTPPQGKRDLVRSSLQ